MSAVLIKASVNNSVDVSAAAGPCRACAPERRHSAVPCRCQGCATDLLTLTKCKLMAALPREPLLPLAAVAAGRCTPVRTQPAGHRGLSAGTLRGNAGATALKVSDDLGQPCCSGKLYENDTGTCVAEEVFESAKTRTDASIREAVVGRAAGELAATGRFAGCVGI